MESKKKSQYAYLVTYIAILVMIATAIPRIAATDYTHRTDENPGRLVNPCIDPSTAASKMPFCNSSLDLDLRVQDLVSRMSILDKIANLDTISPGIPSLGIKPYNW